MRKSQGCRQKIDEMEMKISSEIQRLLLQNRKFSPIFLLHLKNRFCCIILGQNVFKMHLHGRIIKSF